MSALNKQQLEAFDRQGYILLKQVLKPNQVEQLRTFADQAENQAMSALKANAAGKDFVFSMTFFTTYLNRLLHFHLHAGFESLSILGHPTVLGAAKSLCGDDVVPTIDMMIYKHGGNNAQIPWHQDLIYPSQQFRIATFGLYLDDSEAGNGALKILPGTHDKKRNICNIVKHPQPAAIEIPVEAGDLLIHNPMMVHSSDAMNHGEKRRTLYYEFRPMAQVTKESHWSDDLLQRRLDLMHTARHLYQNQYPDEQAMDWHPDNDRLHDSLHQLYQDPVPFNSANICREG